MSLVLRCQYAAYMNCGTGDTEDFNLIGEGFTSFPESKNPKEYTRKYIHEKTERSDVIGYAPSISYSCDVITGDPVIEKIIDITDNEKLGSDTHVDIVTVNLWESEGEGTYVAYKRKYAVVPDAKGDGVEAMIYTGTLKAVSEVVKGTFTLASKAFAPATAE